MIDLFQIKDKYPYFGEIEAVTPAQDAGIRGQMAKVLAINAGRRANKERLTIEDFEVVPFIVPGSYNSPMPQLLAHVTCKKTMKTIVSDVAHWFKNDGYVACGEWSALAQG